jgi:PD-(D/E)XK nuclease superfamily
MAFIVRTSDRINFKACRQAWDFGSKLRQNYEPISLPKPLDFGSAIHSGLEIIYEPKTWHLISQESLRGVILAAALQTFAETNRTALLRYEAENGPDELVRQDFAERAELGNGMLNHYFDWIVGNKEWEKYTPVYVEIEFEVPIIVPKYLISQLPLGDQADINANTGEYELLKYNVWTDQHEPVMYQGRIDSIWQDHLGRYWIVDHKTAAQLREDVLAHLELDEQMKSYGWAIQQQLGIKIAGIIYNELYKGFPEPPQPLKTVRLGRSFSVSKSIDTTYHMYRKVVSEEDAKAFQAGLYDDMLDFLINSGNKFFRRASITYSDYEYEYLGYQICLEALDMFDSPRIYANPSRFRCGYCMFRKPCLAKMDNSDVDFVLKQLYIKRS